MRGLKRFSPFYLQHSLGVGKMEIEIGAEVTDRNGKQLGKVVKVIPDIWSGEVKRFLVSQSTLTNAEVFSIDQVTDVDDKRVRLNIS
jgi:sporulation protein YlmC with PRC-barrel domain